MKTFSQTGRMIAAAAILFAVTLSGCEKADVIPANNNNVSNTEQPTTFEASHTVSTSPPTQPTPRPRAK